MVVAGTCAGLVAGLFGAGGGLVLVPLLTLLTDTEDASVFSSSISIILPICLICIAVTAATIGISFPQFLEETHSPFIYFHYLLILILNLILHPF